MKTETPRLATGPALMEKLLELEQKFDDLATEARAHWSRDEERMRLVDQFVDPQLGLEHLMHELHRVLDQQREALGKLSTAIELHLSDPGTTPVPEAREINGERMRQRESKN
jgi:hypothetical protein